MYLSIFTTNTYLRTLDSGYTTMSSTIEDRAILLLNYNSSLESSKHGFWERLSESTNIASKRWRNVYARDQRITSDMLESLAKLFPTYAFWLVTGITDAVNGHVAPLNAQIFPERLYGESGFEDYQYFIHSLALSKELIEKNGISFNNENERLNAYQRTKPFSHWWESSLCEAAYTIAKTDDYKQLESLRVNRELRRARIIDYITKPTERPWVKKQMESSLTQHLFLGIDPRTKHQDIWDLYYKPADTEESTPPTLNDNQTS